MELTATGIVTDFHRIPYYPWSVATDKDPFALQIYEIFYLRKYFGSKFLRMWVVAACVGDFF